jgi:hypothetical protein
MAIADGKNVAGGRLCRGQNILPGAASARHRLAKNGCLNFK